MLYPLKFKPILKERVWGGKGLEQVMGKRDPKGRKIGESWELSSLQGDLSVVKEGALKGNSIEELIEVYMGDLVGDAVYQQYGVEFPLLIKLIDAQQRLSLQVHPSDKLARERHNSYGKTEMWYVVECEEGAEIYLGFKKEVTKEQYKEALESGELSSLLKKVKVKKGDSFLIPSGMVHAIGQGVMIAEIQQTSDITYRLDDWGRVDDNGEPRELHRELALDAIDFGANYAQRHIESREGVVELERTVYFTTNKLTVEGESSRDYMELDSFVIYICVEGAFKVGYSEGEVGLKRGETLLVPAIEDSISLNGQGVLLEVYIKN